MPWSSADCMSFEDFQRVVVMQDQSKFPLLATNFTCASCDGIFDDINGHTGTVNFCEEGVKFVCNNCKESMPCSKDITEKKRKREQEESSKIPLHLVFLNNMLNKARKESNSSSTDDSETTPGGPTKNESSEPPAKKQKTKSEKKSSPPAPASAPSPVPPADGALADMSDGNYAHTIPEEEIHPYYEMTKTDFKKMLMNRLQADMVLPSFGHTPSNQ